MPFDERFLPDLFVVVFLLTLRFLVVALRATVLCLDAFLVVFLAARAGFEVFLADFFVVAFFDLLELDFLEPDFLTAFFVAMILLLLFLF